MESILQDVATPAIVRPWLESLEEALRTEAEQTYLSEVNEEVNAWSRTSEDPSSPERQWAIHSLHRLGYMDRLLKLVSADELVTILSSAQ